MTTDLARWLWTLLAVALWLGLAGAVAWRTRRAAARSRRDRQAAPDDAVIVAFASQTGFAETLAVMTARGLAQAGVPARAVSFADVDRAALAAAGRALFIVSTTGEGDAPDSAVRFVRRVMTGDERLSHLSCAVLALGDRSYDRYCGFGRAVTGWLRRSGASILFDTVEVDDGDAAALRHWQHQVATAFGVGAGPDWAAPAYDRWRLVERRLLNPGGPGGQAWHLAFEPIDHAPDWSAGDIVEVGVAARDGEPAPASREYSVASLPADGRLELLVRLATRPDGSPGLASGALTQQVAIGGEVAMRLRANRAFHAPDPTVPLILIGAGTGLAGLRAHLKARAARPGSGPVWLLFGERTRAHDAFHDAELQTWLGRGVLTRLDRAFSRDQARRLYVQHLVAENAAEIAAWIDRGAAIMVCGARDGMATGVHAALETALGVEALIALTEAGRYRRDVY